MPLPDSFRWADGDDGSVLHLRYGAVARVWNDGRVKILGACPIEAKAASLAQGKRHVERWFEHNMIVSARGLEMREALAARGFKRRRW